MKRTAIPLLALSVLVGSCVGSDEPTGVDGPVELQIPVNPALIPSPADAGALPINRIRAQALRVPDNVELGSAVVDVTPTDTIWTVDLTATLTTGTAQVMVQVFLINVSGGVEEVQFSGVVGPLSIDGDTPTDVADVPIVRGPLENLLTTGVTITLFPDTLLEGTSGPLSAAATSSGSGTPTVFWTSIDSLTSITDTTVSALLPGTGQIVASAGTFTDTASIVVVPAPANIIIQPDTAFATAIGQQATFTATVVDARGDTLALEQVTWRSGTPALITSLGGGTFEAAAAGTGRVEAVSVTVPSVIGQAFFNVAPPLGGPDILLTVVAADSTPAENDLVAASVVLYNQQGQGATDVTGLEITNVVTGGIVVTNPVATRGTFDAQTGVWNVGTLEVDSVASLGFVLQMPAGSAGQVLSDSAFVSAMNETDVNPTNNEAAVSFNIQQRQVDVEVFKTIDVPQPLADSAVVFSVLAINHGPGAISGLQVFDSIPPEFLNPAHSVSTGSRTGHLWTVPTLAQGDTAIWTTSATVAQGVASTSTTNTAFIQALDQIDSVAANDTSVVVVNFPNSGVPVVQITNPPDGSVYDPGVSVMFAGTATDPEDGSLTNAIAWESTVDGPIGTGGGFSTTTLSTGFHLITATATDSGGDSGADTISVTVALYTVPPTINVPFGGTTSLPITLTVPAPAGGVTLDVVSADPAVTAPTTPTVFIPQGAFSANATLQGLAPGFANVTVSNPQYGAAVSAAAVTADFDISNTSLTFASPFPQQTTITFENQGVPIGAPMGGLNVVMTSNDATCAVAAANPTIPGGQTNTTATIQYGGSAQLPCSTYVYATATGVQADSVWVTVNVSPTISLSARTVGSGLQEATTVSLGVGNHNGTTIRLTSADPGTILVSPDQNTPGTDFIDIVFANGTSARTFYVQALEGATGTANVSASGTGFVTGNQTFTAIQPGLVLSSVSTSGSTFSADDIFWASVGRPNGSTVVVQNIRAGGTPIQVTFSTDNVAVVGLVDSLSVPDDTLTATIPVGLYYTPTSVGTGGVAQRWLSAGTATLTGTAPGVTTQVNGSRTVTVSTPAIGLSARTIGSGLQESTTFSLGASQHGGVDISVWSLDGSTVQVSPDVTTAGADSMVINVPNGSSSRTIYVHAVEGTTGTANVVVAGTGFTPDTTLMTAVQPAVTLTSLTSSTTTLTNPDPFYASIGRPSGNGVAIQNIRAGGVPVPITFAVDDSSIVAIGDSTAVTTDTAVVTIPVGLYYTPTSIATGGVHADPLTAGVATFTASAPGYITATNGTRAVTVSAPQMSTGNRTVGSGLQVSNTVSLGATGHGGVTVRVASRNLQLFLVSPDANTPGTAFIDVAVAAGVGSFTYFVQGLEGATGVDSLDVTAPGFVTDAGGVTVVQPGIVLSSLQTNTTTLSPNDDFYASIGYPSGNSVVIQNIRAGGTPVGVTFTSSDLPVVGLWDGTNLTASTIDTIPVGLYYTPTSVGTGGTQTDPTTAGTSTITATAPGFITQPNGSQLVTVTTPSISTSNRTVGFGLQESNTFFLGASAHGGVTVTVVSLDPNTMRVAPDANTPGTDSIQVFMADGTTGATFWVQGMEGATGSPQFVVRAPGFLDGQGAVTVVQPGIALTALSTTRSVASGRDDFYARVGYPSGNGVVIQNIRAGGAAVTVTFTSTDPAAGRVYTQQDPGPASVDVTIPIGSYFTPTNLTGGGVSHEPLAPGATTISAAAPGFVQTPNATVVVTITP